MHNNLFIAIEGIDGSGKSSQVKLLAEKMEQAGHKVYATFEPTDNYIGSTIRKILRGQMKADNRTIAGLFLADRLDHLLNEDYGLVNKLRQGYSVISDRYYFSSYAYHAVHMDMDWVIDANKMCAQILRPTVNIFIDVLPETSMARISAAREQIELYETLGNLTAVRQKYQEAFAKLGGQENILTIDGNRQIAEIAADIWTGLTSSYLKV